MAGQAEEPRSPQRRAHERMTADQFIWWLRGYLAAAVVEKTPLAFGDVKVIQEAIDRVGPVQPPVPAPPRNIFARLGQDPCPRCGKYPGLGAHFCNGVLSP
jgi:hypothetical protein